MNRLAMVLVTGLVCVIAVIGCSSGGGNAILPSTDTNPLVDTADHSGQTQTHLWGFFDVYIDIETQTVTAVPNRQLMFSVNVVSILNGNPTTLAFSINDTPLGPDYIDVDIDVTLTHPFPGMNMYDGYDVRGVFMGDGTATLSYGNGLKYSVHGLDQSMLPDPDGGNGAPDGYTRWYNAKEFTVPGLFGYMEGKVATPGYIGTATLCPYKYFADGLGTHDDVFEWLDANSDSYGVFSAGTSNTRNYYIRFPTAKGVKYSYAVVANWAGENIHPANTRESVACEVDVTESLWYIDPGDLGGNLILDISIFDWFSEVTSVVMEDYQIFIESTVLSSGYELSPAEMTPTDGDDHFSTYHVDIPSDMLEGWEDNEYWIIVEYPESTYQNDFNVPNLVNDPLAAFYRYDLEVSPVHINQIPVCDVEVITPMPFNGSIMVEFDASGSYDPDGDPLTFEWDFDGDGIFGDPYNMGPPDKPRRYYGEDYTGDVCVRVSDPDGGVSECCVWVQITADPGKNIPIIREGVVMYDIAVDHADGDLLCLYGDGEVWKFTEADDYLVGNIFFSTQAGCDRIDISPNSYSIVGGNASGSTSYAETYDHTGTLIATHTFAETNGLKDVMGSTGSSWQDTHAMLTDHSFPGYMWISRFTPPAYGSAGGNLRFEGYGVGNLMFDLILGAETSDGSYYIYILEDDPEWRVERYNMYMSYTGVSFGGHGTGNTSFNDPRDITRNTETQPTYYVLDVQPSGAPRVKKFDSGGSGHGHFGNATSIYGDPIAIEGSDYNGSIFVLHDEGLSIFTSDET